jgi:nitrogen fixation protein FixH
MTREFTGRHMLISMIAFFGVIIAVNLFMTRMAIKSFGGRVVENSYVASQNFNRWLAAADRQVAMRWQGAMTLDAKRRIVARISQNGQRLAAPFATGQARQPLGGAAPLTLVFDTLPNGQLRSQKPVPSGRWIVSLSVKQNGETAMFMESLR